MDDVIQELDNKQEILDELHRAAELCVKFGILTSYNREDSLIQLTDEFKNYVYVLSLDMLNIYELKFHYAFMSVYDSYQELYKHEDFKGKDEYITCISFVAVHLALNGFAGQLDGSDMVDMASLIEAYLGDLSENE